MVRQLFADESDDEHDLDKEFDYGDRLLQEIREADKGVGDLKQPYKFIAPNDFDD